MSRLDIQSCKPVGIFEPFILEGGTVELASENV